LAAPALAADISRLPEVITEGVENPGQNQMVGGAVLVVSVTVDTFTDNGLAYQTELNTQGVAADLLFDPQLNGWPDLSGYETVFVVYNDVWWDQSLGAFGPADEAVLAGYGGNLVLVGQDYPFSVGTGFITGRFDIASLIEDVNFGDAAEMTLAGTVGGPFEGLGGTGLPCWEANPWFTDDVLGGTTPTQDWSGGGFGGGGGAAVEDGIFSTNEYACFDSFPDAIADMLDYFRGTVPTKVTTWSQIKGEYR
jgi:hypothetical protein